MVKPKVEVDLSAGFTKSQFLASPQWEGIDKDILSVVLEDGKPYTLAEATKLVNQFKNSEVK
ncbi:hypothetical protein D3C74_404820 [compost metagenome]